MLTQRLGSSTQKNHEFTDSLVAEIKTHPGCCDEVWFATDYGFPPLEKHKSSADSLIYAAEKFREAGVRVSLQLSNSIGHGQYMRSRDCTGLVSPQSKVSHMVDADGTTAGYCFCWNDKVFRDYTVSALRYYLRAVKPHTLWIDDDLRAVNHDPVSHGCFCDECIRLFNERYKTDFDREGLVDAIHKDIETRKKHIEFLRDSLASFTFDIGKAVKEEVPGCRMGLQGCANGGYTGYGYAFVFDAMLASTGIAPAYRAGGGSYNDYSPVDFLKKAAFIAFQNHMLPDYVAEKRPEIENLPDVVYGKSIAGTCFETTCYLAWGNTAMSYAMLMNDYEPMSWHGEMLAAFSAHRDYWQKLASVSQKSTLAGLAPFAPKTAFLAESKKPFDYSHEEIFFADGLRFCGVPVNYTKDNAKVWVINGRVAQTLSDSEAKFLLKSNVVCDGRAVSVLAERGFLKGIDAKEKSVQELRERFTDHKINSSAVGRTWGGQIWRHNDYEIIGENLEVIAEYYSESSGKIENAGVSAAVFQTGFGGTWAVFGFDLWERTKSTEKRSQFLNACEYISGSRFECELLTPLQACVIPAVDKEKRVIAASIINCTVGKSGKLKVIIRNPASAEFKFMSMTQPEIKLTAKKIKDNEYLVELPSIDGWSVGSVFCE